MPPRPVSKSDNKQTASKSSSNQKPPLMRTYSLRESPSQQKQTEKSVPKTSYLKRGTTVTTVPEAVNKQRSDKLTNSHKTITKQNSVPVKIQDGYLSSNHSLSSSYSSLNGIAENSAGVNVSKISIQIA